MHQRTTSNLLYTHYMFPFQQITIYLLPSGSLPYRHFLSLVILHHGHSRHTSTRGCLVSTLSRSTIGLFSPSHTPLSHTYRKTRVKQSRRCALFVFMKETCQVSWHLCLSFSIPWTLFPPLCKYDPSLFSKQHFQTKGIEPTVHFFPGNRRLEQAYSNHFTVPTAAQAAEHTIVFGRSADNRVVFVRKPPPRLSDFSCTSCTTSLLCLCRYSEKLLCKGD